MSNIGSVIEFIDAIGVLPISSSKNKAESKVAKWLEKTGVTYDYKGRREVYWEQRLEEAKNHLRLIRNGGNPHNVSIERWIKRQRALRNRDMIKNKEMRRKWDDFDTRRISKGKRSSSIEGKRISRGRGDPTGSEKTRVSRVNKIRGVERSKNRNKEKGVSKSR